MFGFGKKKEEEDLFSSEGEGRFPPAEDAFDEHTPLSETPRPAPGIAQPIGDGQNPFQSQAIEQNRAEPVVQQPVSNNSSDKIEIVIAKLDSLKSNIEVINQRLISLEHKLAQQERRW